MRRSIHWSSHLLADCESKAPDVHELVTQDATSLPEAELALLGLVAVHG